MTLYTTIHTVLDEMGICLTDEARAELAKALVEAIQTQGETNMDDRVKLALERCRALGIELKEGK